MVMLAHIGQQCPFMYSFYGDVQVRATVTLFFLRKYHSMPHILISRKRIPHIDMWLSLCPTCAVSFSLKKKLQCAFLWNWSFRLKIISHICSSNNSDQRQMSHRMNGGHETKEMDARDTLRFLCTWSVCNEVQHFLSMREN